VQPENATYHFRLAQAIEADPAARPERARSHYLKALQIEPKNATYWLEYAVYLLTLGYTPRGLKALRRAYALGDNNPAIVGQVAETLRQEGLVDEARTKLVAALFNHPRDRRFRALWQEHQFVMLYDQQQSERLPETARRRARPTLLPFVARETTGRFTRLGARTLRLDPPRRLKGPTTMQRQPRRRPQ
jgi:tetratricopeptide (TPR) repeat protein